MNARYKAIDIARWFIMRNMEAEAFDGGDKLSLMKLLKLMYYAEGCALAMDNSRSLFDEDILAWEHGPVIESVWQKYRNDPFNLPFGTDEDHESLEKISPADNNLLEKVFDVFGDYSASGLRNMTHEETPWKEAYNGKRPSGVISRETMKEYFKEHYVA